MKVKIREWADMERDFGLDRDGNIKCWCGFLIEMKEYCGKIIEVDEIDDLKGDFKYDGWYFNNDMYEIIEE